MKARSIKPRWLALTIALIVLGIAWRTLPLGLPFWAFKYGGSALWAAMLYTLAAAFLPRPLIPTLLLAYAIEFLKLLHTPTLDHFRLTLPGKLLLGRVFSLADLAVYTVAILFTHYLASLRRR